MTEPYQKLFPNMRADSDLAEKLNEAIRTAGPADHSPFCSIRGIDPKLCSCHGWAEGRTTGGAQ